MPKGKDPYPAETGSSLKVNTHIAETDRGLRFSRPSKRAFLMRETSSRGRKGFCNIVIRTELKSRNNAVFITRSRQKNNWYILFAFHGGANNKAAAVRKRNIQQHNIKLLLFKKPQRFGLPVCAFAQKPSSVKNELNARTIAASSSTTSTLFDLFITFLRP